MDQNSEVWRLQRRRMLYFDQKEAIRIPSASGLNLILRGYHELEGSDSAGNLDRRGGKFSDSALALLAMNAHLTSLQTDSSCLLIWNSSQSMIIEEL